MRGQVIAGVVAILTSSFVYADNIALPNLALWTFETSVPTTAGPHAAEGGVYAGSGSTGFHTAATVFSNPVGNGSAESFSSTNWRIGDYYQFQTSSAAYQNIAISWDQTSSGGGPKAFKLQYSTDGTIFTDHVGGSYNVLENGASPNGTWDALTRRAAYTYSYNLSTVLSLNNDSSIYFRLVNTSTTSASGGTIATAGTDRVDNFLVEGAAVPLPAVVPLPAAAVGGMALMGGFGLTRLRRAFASRE